MVVADVEAETLMQFTFELTNPAVRVDGSAPTVSTPMVPPIAMRSDLATRPLTVLGAEFDVKRIGQSSPWPCDLNTITVSLVSNTPLLASCSPEITIAGKQP